jgi:hypothetical protein
MSDSDEDRPNLVTWIRSSVRSCALRIRSIFGGDPLATSIHSFVRSFPKEAEFPLGGELEIPTQAERNLLRVLESGRPFPASTIASLRSELGIHDAYALVIFSVRMAVFAVRRNEAKPLLLGLMGLVIDDGKVDWRDILSALSIVENCAARLGIAFAPAMEEFYPLASPQRRDTIKDGYFAREPDMRKIEIMGFVASGSGKVLTFNRQE